MGKGTGKEEEKMILDVGCGSVPRGTVNLDIAMGETPHLGDLYGINNKIMPRSITNFVCGDAHYLPFKDSVFSKVICHHTLEHLDNPTLALKEMARVTNGEIEVIVPWQFCEKIHNRFLPFRRKWAEKYHKWHFTKKQLETMLGGHGLVQYHFRIFRILKNFKQNRGGLKEFIFYGLIGTILPPLPELKAVVYPQQLLTSKE